MNLSSGAGTHKSESLIPQRSRGHQSPAQSLSVIAQRPRDHAWWAEEAARTGTDWRSLTDAVLEVLVSAGIIRLEQSTFELACEQADRDRPLHPSRSGAAMSAPPTSIEALMFSLRRGVNELAHPDTLRRLSALDGDQVKQVCRRVQAFQPEIAEPWSTDEVDALISAWRRSR